MSLSNVGISYLLLVIPTLFALVVLGQGLYKVSRNEADGQLISIFGAIFLMLIGAAWWFFIR